MSECNATACIGACSTSNICKLRCPGMTAVMLPASTGRTLASVRIQCDLMHRCMGCLYWSFSSVAYLSWRSSSYYGIFILEFLQCGLFILVVFQLQWNLYTGVPPVCLETTNWPRFVCASGYIPIHKRPPLSCDIHNARMRPRMQHFKIASVWSFTTKTEPASWPRFSVNWFTSNSRTAATQL